MQISDEMIKRLEWGWEDEDTVANSIVGLYKIEPFDGGWEPLLNGNWISGFFGRVLDTPEEARAAAQSDYETIIRSALVTLPTANCCHCGRIIDTREQKDGGDPFGAQLSDKRWTCSIECWDAIVDPPALVTPTDVGKVAFHDIVRAIESEIDTQEMLLADPMTMRRLRCERIARAVQALFGKPPLSSTSAEELALMAEGRRIATEHPSQSNHDLLGYAIAGYLFGENSFDEAVREIRALAGGAE